MALRRSWSFAGGQVQPAGLFPSLVQQRQTREALAAAPAPCFGEGLVHQGVKQLPLGVVLGVMGPGQGGAKP